MARSAASSATPGASAPAERKGETMPEGTETGQMKDPMNSTQALEEASNHSQEIFFDAEEFIAGALEYLKSLLPAQP